MGKTKRKVNRKTNKLRKRGGAAAEPNEINTVQLTDKEQSMLISLERAASLRPFTRPKQDDPVFTDEEKKEALQKRAFVLKLMEVVHPAFSNEILDYVSEELLSRDFVIAALQYCPKIIGRIPAELIDADFLQKVHNANIHAIKYIKLFDEDEPTELYKKLMDKDPELVPLIVQYAHEYNSR